MKLDILLDTRKKMPLHEQFAEGIKILAAERKLMYGYQFESIKVIAESFGLEEDMFIKGFQILEKQGFVKLVDDHYQLLPIMLTHKFYHQVIPLYQAIHDAGYESMIHTIDIKFIQKLPNIFNVLDDDKQGFIYVKRVYFANQMPMAVLEGYYPKKYFPEKVSAYKDTLFYLYYKELGHQLKASKRMINVVHPSEEISQLLYHPKEVASIQYISNLLNQEDEVLEYSIAHASMNYTIYLKETLYRED